MECKLFRHTPCSPLLARSNVVRVLKSAFTPQKYMANWMCHRSKSPKVDISTGTLTRTQGRVLGEARFFRTQSLYPAYGPPMHLLLLVSISIAVSGVKLLLLLRCRASRNCTPPCHFVKSLARPVRTQPNPRACRGHGGAKVNLIYVSLPQVPISQ